MRDRTAESQLAGHLRRVGDMEKEDILGSLEDWDKKTLDLGGIGPDGRKVGDRLECAPAGPCFSAACVPPTHC